ncbi:hypothetical protein GE061_003640 [Apolygus lucorum]|uniref:Uncharacterized protein n=1 Tax=Apolygus lucorum TaxID=248454 RepID=A0A8S9X2L5_APOLU|nr:hypothetical protein GE061_003640 [Apolygus lucorum]
MKERSRKEKVVHSDAARIARRTSPPRHPDPDEESPLVEVPHVAELRARVACRVPPHALRPRVLRLRSSVQVRLSNRPPGTGSHLRADFSARIPVLLAASATITARPGPLGPYGGLRLFRLKPG